METQPLISFIVVNYHSREYLAGCIASIAAHSARVGFEIIVVNNEATPLLLDTSIGPINTIEVGENIGFAAAANRGAKNARGEFLCFLNPDAQFVSGDLLDILDRFRKDPTIGIIGPKIMTPAGTAEPWSAGNDLTLWSLIRNNCGFSDSRPAWDRSAPTEVGWVSGACLFVSKKIFREINGFDEQFFMYFEDVDLGRRVRRLGREIWLQPDMIVRHLGGGSFTQNGSQKKLYYASQDRYLTKYYGAKTQKIAAFLRRLSGKV